MRPWPAPRVAGRVTLRRLLGVAWLIDAILQSEPAKWHARFLTDDLSQAAMGQPPWLNHLVLAALRPLSTHWTVVNGAVVMVEAALGIALLAGRAPRAWLGASIGCSAAIWIVGEGFGFLPSGQALLLGGAPGPALLYGAIAALSWPGSDRADADQRLWSFLWVGLWLGGAALQLAGSWPAAQVLVANLTEHSAGQPAPLQAAARAAVRLAGAHPVALPVGLAVLQASIGVGAVLATRWSGALLAAGAALALVFWVVGEQCGGIFTSGATDVGLGPLLVALAAAGSPRPPPADRWVTGLRRATLVLSLIVVVPSAVTAGLLRPRLGRAVLRTGCRLTARLVGVRVYVAGAERLPDRGPYLVCANHSSLLDIPALMIAIPNLRLVMAADLLPGALRRLARRAFGLETVDRRRPTRGVRDLALLADRFGSGPLAIFPEGAIAPAGRQGDFKAGAFALAVKAGVAVVPVAIHHTAKRLPPGAALRVSSGPVVVEVLETIESCVVGHIDRRRLRDLVEDRVSAAMGGGGTKRPIAGRSSAQVEPVEVHDLVPCRREVPNELVGPVVGSVDLGEGAKLGVRSEDQVDSGGRPLDLARGAIATLVQVLRRGRGLPLRGHV